MASSNGTRKGNSSPRSELIDVLANEKLPSAPSATSTPSQPTTGKPLVDPKRIEKFISNLPNKDGKVTLKLKFPPPKQTNPGNWMDNKIEGEENKKDFAPTSPIVNPIDPTIAAAFPTGRPLHDKPDILQCKHCKKPVLRHAATAHVKDCLKKKQEKAQKKKEAKEAKDAALRKERNGGVSPDPSVDEDSGKRGSVSARKTAVNGDGGGKKPGKKRKADEDSKGPSAKKKKKEEVKAKTGKPKGPVDVEKQCGVLLPDGKQCARSLTCKSHSMGAKRAVPGRSLPYDMLLAQYQKKNQAKQQREFPFPHISASSDLPDIIGAAIDANAPLADDFEPPGTVDSDEERDSVLAAINRSFVVNPLTGARLGGKPIVTSTIIPTRRKYQYVRVKEMLQHALGGARGANLFSTQPAMPPSALPSASGFFSGGHDGMVHNMDGFDGSRKASTSMSHRGSTHGLPGSRKVSISGQV